MRCEDVNGRQSVHPLVGTYNAGFRIIEAESTYPFHGYCLGKSDMNYVVCGYWERKVGEAADFFHGNYIPIDHDDLEKSQAAAYAAYYERLARAFRDIAKYGWE